MSIEITMPKLGFDMQEGILLNWLKKKGDQVNAGEPILEIETDKASVEVESFNSGVLTHIFFEPGQVVKVGAIIGLLDGQDKDLSQEVDASSNNNVSIDNPDHDSPISLKGSLPPMTSPRKSESNAVKISPLARRIAKERGVDYLSLRGTGPGGMIVKRDIFSMVAEAPQPQILTPLPILQPGDEKVPLSRMRKAIAKRMVLSNAEVPQFNVAISIEMENALDLRSRFNTIHQDSPLSINDLVIRAAALVLQKYPRLNSSYQDLDLQIHHHINIGVAVSLEEGLLTVVIRDADKKSLSQISMETRMLIQRTREGKNKPEDLVGSTFTISNLGMYGIDEFNAIINPPEAAILAVGAVQTQPKLIDGVWEPRSMARFNLTIDHRVSDGAEAARYLKELKTHLEEPVYLI